LKIWVTIRFTWAKAFKAESTLALRVVTARYTVASIIHWWFRFLTFRVWAFLIETVNINAVWAHITFDAITATIVTEYCWCARILFAASAHTPSGICITILRGALRVKFTFYSIASIILCINIYTIVLRLNLFLKYGNQKKQWN
jgi:hypothetical protein